MATSRLRLNRSQLSKFLTDHGEIKQFEALFSAVDELTSTDLGSVQELAEGADAKANQALAQLTRIADAMEEIANTPLPSTKRIEQIESDIMQMNKNKEVLAWLSTE